MGIIINIFLSAAALFGLIMLILTYRVREHIHTYHPTNLFNLTLLFSGMFFVSIAILGELSRPNVSDLIESNNHKQQLIERYEDYYFYSEQLLDSLDSKYDWVDAFDPQEYYSAKDNIQDLCDQEQ